MKKINLIAILIMFAVAGSLSTTFTSCSKKAGKNIGLQLYSVRDSIRNDVPGAVEKWEKWATPLLRLPVTVTVNSTVWNQPNSGLFVKERTLPAQFTLRPSASR